MANAGPISLDMLRSERFLLPDKLFDTDQAFAEAFAVAGFEPEIFNINLRRHGSLDLVSYGLCVMLQHKKYVQKLGGSNIAFVDIIPTRSLNINFVYSDKRMSNTESRFLEFVKNY